MLRSQLQFHGINSSVNVTQIDDLVELLTETNDIILERCVRWTLDTVCCGSGSATWTRIILVT
jgi:hypothetical protein